MTANSRLKLIETAQQMAACGLNKGTAGNLSVREQWQEEAGFWITPTGMDYAELRESDIPFVEIQQPENSPFPRKTGASPRRASSEWRLHRDIYLAHPDAGAILHAHSPFATSLACIGQEIPSFHYMIARFGGNTVRCAPYALFGTQALSDVAVNALESRSACLLANHGMVVFASTLKMVLDAAIELEALCEQYWRARQLGAPRLLSEVEMADVHALFANYGKQDGE